MHSAFVHRYLPLLIVIAFIIGLSSCKTVETTREGRRVGTASDSVSASEVTESGIDLSAYRNSLGDLYTTQNHEMPDFFMESYDGLQSGNRDPYDGYRIQLVSTRDVALADSIAESFRIWSDTTIVGFNPEAHQFFKPPHYKVHAGDFSERQRAIEFSRLVKQKYPDAWVVHDRIDPNLVPADTVEIRLRDERDISKADTTQ